MLSAVLDRILAIPDLDGDRPQMGLSRSGLAALVERGGVTTDGTKAKPSVLKRADVKGDKKLSENTSITSDQARKIKGAIAGVKGGKVVKGKSPSDRNSSKAISIKTFKELELEANKKGLKVEKVAKNNIRSSGIIFKDKDNKVVARTDKNIEDAANYLNNPYAKHNVNGKRTIAQIPDEELSLSNSPSTGTKAYNRAVNRYDNYRKKSSH